MKRVLVERAREFRKEPTRGEAALWEELRGRALGVRFYRQQVIGPFIADFACERPRLIVEVDGPVHEGQRERDEERQAWLEQKGYAVLRVSAEEAENGSATSRIRCRLGELRAGGGGESASPPLPRAPLISAKVRGNERG